jgi:hypothetical protein
MEDMRKANAAIQERDAARMKDLNRSDTAIQQRDSALKESSDMHFEKRICELKENAKDRVSELKEIANNNRVADINNVLQYFKGSEVSGLAFNTKMAADVSDNSRASELARITKRECDLNKQKNLPLIISQESPACFRQATNLSVSFKGVN